jgi:hypothetical protein
MRQNIMFEDEQEMEEVISSEDLCLQFIDNVF